MSWNFSEAVSYYRRQGAPTDQSASIALLKEIQAIAGDAASISKYSDEASGEIANFFMILCPFYDF